MIVLYYALLIIGSYFIGNISFAIIISKKKNGDITKVGSGNPGTMNMLRTYGFKLGFLTLVLDTLKGAIPSLIGLLIFGKVGLYTAGLSAILGHIFPVVRKFKGGKGIACTLGVFLVADPLFFFIFFIIGAIYLYFFDYGVIASFILVTSLTVIEGIKSKGDLAVSLLLFAIFFITWFAHRENFTRLLTGKENKVHFRLSLQKAFAKKNLSHEEKVELKKEKKEKKEKVKKREIG